MDEATRKRIAAKSWLSRVANKLRQTLESESSTQTELIEQIEEFEKRLLHLDEVQTLVEAKIE